MGQAPPPVPPPLSIYKRDVLHCKTSLSSGWATWGGFCEFMTSPRCIGLVWLRVPSVCARLPPAFSVVWCDPTPTAQVLALSLQLPSFSAHSIHASLHYTMVSCQPHVTAVQMLLHTASSSLPSSVYMAAYGGTCTFCGQV